MADPAELYAQLIAAFEQRAWPQASTLARQLLPLAPRHAGAHYMAGIASMELRQMEPALALLQRACALEPGRAGFVTQLAKALVLSRRGPDAKMVADQAMSLSPSDPALLDTLGVIYTQVGDHASAANVFRQATTLAPQQASFRFNFATSLVAAGDVDAAEVELEACLALAPRHGLAHLTLARLRQQSPDSNHVQRLQARLDELADDGDADARICLAMALAKECDDLGDYDKAFDYLSRGKAAAARGRRYSIERDQALFTAIMSSFPQPSAVAQGCLSDEPIFIVGMPRSGTTLVERIISSHPDVHSAGELLNFAISLKQLSGCRSAALVDEATILAARQVDWKQLGEAYLNSTRPASGRTPRFIDKLPHNFLYAGHIAHALPNAKIICMRRNPMDTCLGNFRQLFGANMPFFDYSHDLLDIGRYYVLFDRLMAHWRSVLPGRVLEMEYETLVQSQEASSRALLAFCGLSWHDDCLRFEQNPGAVATASATQVRAPMHRDAIARWKKYGPRLDSLHDLLTAAGIQLT